MADGAHFELALRNACDCVLSERFDGCERWLFGENSPVACPVVRKSNVKKLRDVNLVSRCDVENVRRRVRGPFNPNQVVAGLMLGFCPAPIDVRL